MTFFIFLLLIFQKGFCSLQIPVFKVSSDTHYEAHRKIGEHFRSRISDFLAEYTTMNDTLLPFFENHNEQYELWRKTVESQFPKIYDEIRGIADGAKIDFHKIFLLQMRTEIENFSSMKDEFSSFESEHCTDIILENADENQSIRGHNEDGNILNKNYAYFVDVEITKESNERLFSYCYPGIVPGIAFGFNSYGLVFSGNAVTPSSVRVGRTIPKTIVYRASMSCTSIEDCIRLLMSIDNRAYGNNINIGSIHSPKRQISIELSPFEAAIVEHHKGNFSHVNDYKILKIPFIPEESSIHRQKRINEFPIWTNEKDILQILGDTQDKDYPIYRTASSKKDSLATLCTVFFDLNQKKAKIWTQNPKINDPVQSFDLTF